MLLVVTAVIAVCLFLLALRLLVDRKPTAPRPRPAARGKDGHYTAAEVARHASADDAWIIVKGLVYDVTPYVEEHPGGEAILRHAGGDATTGFMGPQHPSRVFDILDDFRVGFLVEGAKDK